MNSVYAKSIVRTVHSTLLIFALLLVSCSQENEPSGVSVEGTEISSFSFLESDNSSLDSDIYFNIQDNTISGRVPYNGDIENLVASFDHNGSSIMVDEFDQTSGSTHNNFSQTITYTVKTSDNQQESYEVRAKYFTGLPIFYIDTNGIPIDTKEDYIEGSASIFGGLDYNDNVSSVMGIRGRGHSTWFVHPKKPYQLKFDEKTEVLGMPEDKKWIFLAEYSDKTLMRNKIAFEMGYISNLDWTPESHFAEVFVNNEYNGTYNITQKVEESSNRVVLGDTGYLLEIDDISHIETEDVIFYTGNFLINIKEPELTLDSPEYNYIKDLINEFESVLMSNEYTNPTTGYMSYIDIPSFVDWYLISEITKNQDSKDYSSMYLNVIPGEKIKMGPLWDFDLAFGNVDYSECEYPEGFWVKDHAWYSRLFQDPNFVAQVKSRFTYFRNNQDYILEKMDYYSNYLALSQQENDDKWNTIGTYVWPNPVIYNTYEGEVNHLKNWYIERMNWLDNAFNNL